MRAVDVRLGRVEFAPVGVEYPAVHEQPRLPDLVASTSEYPQRPRGRPENLSVRLRGSSRGASVNRESEDLALCPIRLLEKSDRCFDLALGSARPTATACA